ncbi:MAG: hypothetical protein D6765_09840 [Bacteroidetes bacterium]|nr:MAG: hypothetical protein D6765_09840 [Bacteroidota bacterium]
MAFYLFALEFLQGKQPALRLAMHLLLIPFIGLGIAHFHGLPSKGASLFFKTGMQVGLLITLFTGLTLGLIHLGAFLLGSEWSFTLYGRNANSLGNFLLVSGGMFFEILVFGLIITLGWLQWFKGKRNKL